MNNVDEVERILHLWNMTNSGMSVTIVLVNEKRLLCFTVPRLYVRSSSKKRGLWTKASENPNIVDLLTTLTSLGYNPRLLASYGPYIEGGFILEYVLQS